MRSWPTKPFGAPLHDEHEAGAAPERAVDASPGAAAADHGLDMTDEMLDLAGCNAHETGVELVEGYIDQAPAIIRADKPAAGCCDRESLSTCCEPDTKPDCCASTAADEPVTAPSSCGCR